MKGKYTLVVFVFIFTIISSLESVARNRDLMKAQYYYSVNKFHEAIPYYEKFVDDENDPNLYGELGNCYKMVSKIQKSAEYYAKAVALEGCDPEIILHYGQTLMEMMKYDSAKKYLEIYQGTHPNDRRIKNMIAGCTTAPGIISGKPKGKISFLNFNTNGSEFAPTIWKNYLVYMADVDVDLDRTKNKVEDYTFDKIYYVPCDRKGVTGKIIKKLKIKGVDFDKTHVGPVTFTADGKTMYFTKSFYDPSNHGKIPTSAQITKKPLEIWIATDLDSATNEFQTIKPFKYNSEDYSVAQPTISPNNKMLLFVSDKPGGQGNSDIYLCRLKEDSEWSKPVNVGKAINTEGDESFPFLADERTLFFSSDGHEGLGGLDVYMSQWDEGTNTFSNPVNLGTPVNSSYDDISLSMFPDWRSSYFSSNRPALKGGDNIYYYDRTHAYVNIKLYDDITNNPLNVAVISLQSYGNKQYVDVDKFGEFVAPVYNDVYYKVTVTKNGYEPASFLLNATNYKENDTVLQVVKLKSLNLVRDSDYLDSKKPEPPLVNNEPAVKVRDSSYYKKPSYLILSIVDTITKKPVKNAIIGLSSDRDDRELSTNERGKLMTQLIPEIDYTVKVSRKGYRSKEITVKTIFGKEEPDTFTEKIALMPLKGGKFAAADEKSAETEKAEEAAVKQSADAKTYEKDKTEEKLVSLDGYYAEYNKYKIVEEKKYLLDSLAKQLKNNPKMKIRLYGHADCRGKANYNVRLSTERAVEVGKYLVSQGIDPKRLQHKGVGAAEPKVTCPVCSECTEEQHKHNRGFEYVVIHK